MLTKPSTEIESHAEHVNTTEETIADKIIHLLKIYPKISPSMMQIGIGSTMPVSIWKPVLKDLIDRKIVIEDFIVHPSASGRQQTYTILSLNHDSH